jgi:endonuclease YncB( thermonuclease family)
MRRPYQILLPLLSLFLVRVDLTDLWPLHLTVQLIHLLDADTALVQGPSGPLTVRFSGVDAPEKKQPFARLPGDAGEAATECARKSIGKQKIFKLLIFGQDIYGRILGDLEGLNFKLIKHGCTTLYPHATFSSVKEKWRFIHALRKAKEARRGLWARGGYMQPKLWRKFSKRSARRRSRQ